MRSRLEICVVDDIIVILGHISFQAVVLSKESKKLL